MRAGGLLRAAVAALMIGVLLPGVQAQEPGSIGVLEDPAEDASFQAMGQSQPAPAAVAAAVDLVGLTVTEDEPGFLFTLAVRELPQDTSSGEVLTRYGVTFRHHDVEYRVRVERQVLPGSAPASFTRLERYDPGQGTWFTTTVLSATEDPSAASLSVHVPREILLDASGAEPYPGRALESFWALSMGVLRFADIDIMGTRADATVQDRMPDTGEGAVPVPVVFGIAQTGHARLESLEPFRASNGEATTFVFTVTARNIGQEEGRFDLAAPQVPSGWDVRTPGTITLPAGGSQDVPVVVRTPFAHAHGSRAAFVLEMTSQADPGSVGRIELGVYYPAIPQPAGHHDTLYLHSIDYGEDPLGLAFATVFGTVFGQDAQHVAYMNAAEEDGVDAGTPVGGRHCGMSTGGNDTVTSEYCWTIPLSPGLQMGLDFDLTRTGSITVPIGSVLPLPAARIHGEVYYLAPLEEGEFDFGRFNRETTVLATIETSEAQEVGVDGEAVFEADIVPTPEGDLIPYQRGGVLALDLVLATARPDNFFLGPRVYPELRPGGTLDLPLLEYEDPVDEAFALAGDIVLEAVGEQEKAVNPDKTVVFEAMLRNEGGLEDTFRLALVGSNQAWGRIVGPEKVAVAAGEESLVTVAVTVPPDAVHGDRADLVLEAAGSHSIDARALLRLVAKVDTETDLPDEAEAVLAVEAAHAKDTPGPALALAALAILGLAARRRQR